MPTAPRPAPALRRRRPPPQPSGQQPRPLDKPPPFPHGLMRHPNHAANRTQPCPSTPVRPNQCCRTAVLRHRAVMPSTPHCHDVSGPAGDGHNGRGALDSVPQRHHDERVVRCRRCSERQRRGQPRVSEWFVSEVRAARVPAPVGLRKRLVFPHRLAPNPGQAVGTVRTRRVSRSSPGRCLGTPRAGWLSSPGG
jgi:hypothetical protein